MADQGTYTLAGVMGWPVLHSRSPVIHNHWIAENALHGAYVLLPVPPTELERALRGLPALGFAGCNLTIPHKIAALGLVDHIDPLARSIGAVNTVVVQPDGSLGGYNTDAFGFVESLSEVRSGWQTSTRSALVLGAGGAARAIVAGLQNEGVGNIRVANRSKDKADALAEAFGQGVSAIEWSERHAALDGAQLLVNTTNQGMQGEPALDLQLDQLDTNALVADVVYVPLETPLLRDAAQRGNETVNGLGMLVHQARMAFRLWFGMLPDVSPKLLEKVHATF